MVGMDLESIVPIRAKRRRKEWSDIENSTAKKEPAVTKRGTGHALK